MGSPCGAGSLSAGRPLSAITNRSLPALPEDRHPARSTPTSDAHLGAAPRRRGRLMRQGPLAGRYPAVAAMVLFALIPYLALSAALEPLTPIIARDLHASLQTMSL